MATPDRPNVTTGPNDTSSSAEMTTGTPGGAIFCTTNCARSGSDATPKVWVISAQAPRMSSSSWMCRQMSARSGRIRHCSAVAFRITSKPRSSARCTASSALCTGNAGSTEMP